jgi:hypothetical protein
MVTVAVSVRLTGTFLVLVGRTVSGLGGNETFDPAHYISVEASQMKAVAPSARTDRRNNARTMRSSQKTASKLPESIVQLSPRNSKFRLLAAAGLVFLFGSVAFSPQAEAGNLAADPNALQKIQQFI